MQYWNGMSLLQQHVLILLDGVWNYMDKSCKGAVIHNTTICLVWDIYIYSLARYVRMMRNSLPSGSVITTVAWSCRSSAVAIAVCVRHKSRHVLHAACMQVPASRLTSARLLYDMHSSSTSHIYTALMDTL